MASETLDPIDWSHPSPSWAVPPERLVHSINQCNRSMRGNHLAYEATQGISSEYIAKVNIAAWIDNAQAIHTHWQANISGSASIFQYLVCNTSLANETNAAVQLGWSFRWSEN